MKTDIYQKMEVDFGKDINLAIAQIEILDAKTKGLISDRMIRALVFLAKGSVESFKEYIEVARKDYRDVLWWAEYDGGEEQKYDFNKSFHELGLL